MANVYCNSNVHEPKADVTATAGACIHAQASRGWCLTPGTRAITSSRRSSSSRWLVANAALLFLVMYRLPDATAQEFDDVAPTVQQSVWGALLGSKGDPRECTISGEEYLSSSACSRDVRNEWLRLAAMPVQMDACRVEVATGQIVCDTQIRCEGGTQKHVEHVQVQNIMEYDCSACHDVHKRSCCKQCLELQKSVSEGSLKVGRELIGEAVCKNCEAGDLSAIVPKHPVNCSHDQLDGTFRCSMSEHCSHGRMRTISHNMSYTCTVTPCDTCTNNAAKAQCCTTCLEHYCLADLTFADRRVCRGCSELPRH